MAAAAVPSSSSSSSSFIPSTKDNYAEALHLVQEWVDAGDPNALLELDGPLTKLPPLPSNLKQLRLLYATLDEETILPDSIDFLILDYCSFHLPRWPPRLDQLMITNAATLTLSVLPETLDVLIVEDVPHLTFAAPLPSALSSLILYACQITDPFKRKGPQSGSCSVGAGPLSKLPPLPSSLRMLAATGCGLTTLPRTFPSTLQFVKLEDNKIRRLPVFSPTLQTLEVQRNNLPLPQETFHLRPAISESSLRAYLHDLYAVQDAPGDIPIWGEDGQVNVEEVADPCGKDCWDI